MQRARTSAPLLLLTTISSILRPVRSTHSPCCLPSRATQKLINAVKTTRRASQEATPHQWHFRYRQEGQEEREEGHLGGRCFWILIRVRCYLSIRYTQCIRHTPRSTRGAPFAGPHTCNARSSSLVPRTIWCPHTTSCLYRRKFAANP